MCVRQGRQEAREDEGAPVPVDRPLFFRKDFALLAQGPGPRERPRRDQQWVSTRFSKIRFDFPDGLYQDFAREVALYCLTPRSLLDHRCPRLGPTLREEGVRLRRSGFEESIIVITSTTTTTIITITIVIMIIIIAIINVLGR